MKRLSVVVVAYNEEAVIARTLSVIVDELGKRPELSWELLCVNDGSEDETGRLMDEHARGDGRVHVMHHRRNFGQGRALRTAFDQVSGDIVVTLDADLSYGPEYIFRLVDALEESRVEIALASAYMKGGTVRNVPLYRRFLSRVGNAYLAQMSHYRISTSTCVVRAYRREVLDAVYLTSDGMELQLEILMKAALMGFRVLEIPGDLAWPDTKAPHGKPKRVSKMRILHTIRTYLLMGWLSRPALAFIALACLMLAPATYMALMLLVRLGQGIITHLDGGLSQAISTSLQIVFTQHTYSVVFCGGLMLVGLQILTSSMLMLQNKSYFEELCRLAQFQLQRPPRTGKSD